MDQASLKHLLQEALTSDTARVKEATNKLKTDYYKNPQSLGLLLQILTDDDSSAEIRQIAATQARALVPRHWNAVPDSHKGQVRDHVLQATLGEERALVRHNAARVVAAIAKVDAQDGQWAELPSTLLRCATSGQAREREVGTFLLFTVLDAMGEESAGQFSTLFQLFSKTIHDNESAEVRINTMLALSKMALVIDPDDDEASLHAFQKLLPDMVSVLKQTIDAHDEERTLQSFEVFQTLLEADPRLLNKHFADLVEFMGTAASATDLDKDARVAALNFLVSCVLYRKLKFQALRIGEQMVERLIHILFTSDESAADEEEFGLTLSVLSLLSLMSSQLPPSQAVVPTLQLFKKYASSNEPKQKRSVLTAFASCIEGAPEFLDTQVEEVKPLVLQLLNDSDIHVREAAVQVTKELAEALPEAIGKDHEKFMAGVAKNLNAAMTSLSGSNAEDNKINQEVVVNCCQAIENMAGGLDPEELKPYLAELVPHISHLFSHPEHNVKAAAIAAVGSIAQAAKDGFVPFFEDTMNALQQYVQLKEGDEEMNLRSMTCDAMGDMAIAVGPDHFKRFVQPLMQATEEGLHLDSPRLKETSYMFWGTMAGVYKEDFKPFLQGAVKSIFEALDQKEAEVDIELGGDEELVGQEVTIAGKKVKVVEAAGDDDDDDDEDFDEMDDDDSEDDWADIAGISAVSQEKEVATEALAEIFSNVGSEFLPYFETTIKKVLPELENAYEGLRRSAVSTLFRAYATIFKLNNTEHEPGLPLKHKLSNELSQFGDVLMTATLALWMAEDDENVVMEVNTNLAETLKLTGPAIIAGEGKVEQVVQTLVSILTKKHLCQVSLEEDDDETIDELESSEDEMTLISSAMDTVAGLAAALGPQFGELWKIFEKTILAFASASEPGYRSASIGSIAEVVRGMGSGSAPYVPSLLKVVLHRLADEDPQVKSNAAFAAGMLVEHASEQRGADIAKAFPQILQRLEPMLQTTESRQLDNAAGCVARMIIMQPDSLPLKEILPVLVGVLPLKEDYEENIPVYQMLYKLFDSQQGRALISELGLHAKLRPVFQEVLSDEDQLTDTTRELVKKMASAV